MATSPGLGPVVVGVNGSSTSDDAVDWASDFASLTGRRLLAVHGTGFVGGPNAEDLLEAERVALEAGRLIAGAAVERAHRRHPDLVVAGVSDVGDPPSVLIEHGQGAALLVVGPRREEAFKRLFGSVSISVTRHATCPVVVVRARDLQVPAAMSEHIVLGVDGTATSQEAARFAFEYASLTGLPLVILFGSWERLSRGSSVMALLASGEERGLTEEEELTIAETVAGLPEEYPEVVVHEVHRSTDPAEALITASETAQLVVVGARKMGAARAMVLRSVSTALVEHAHCPVAVVHAQTAR